MKCDRPQDVAEKLNFFVILNEARLRQAGEESLWI